MAQQKCTAPWCSQPVDEYSIHIDNVGPVCDSTCEFAMTDPNNRIN